MRNKKAGSARFCSIGKNVKTARIRQRFEILWTMAEVKAGSARFCSIRKNIKTARVRQRFEIL